MEAKRYKVGDKIYNIPPSEEEGFKKAFPGAHLEVPPEKKNLVTPIRTAEGRDIAGIPPPQPEIKMQMEREMQAQLNPALVESPISSSGSFQYGLSEQRSSIGLVDSTIPNEVSPNMVASPMSPEGMSQSRLISDRKNLEHSQMLQLGSILGIKEEELVDYPIELIINHIKTSDFEPELKKVLLGKAEKVRKQKDEVEEIDRSPFAPVTLTKDKFDEMFSSPLQIQSREQEYDDIASDFYETGIDKYLSIAEGRYGQIALLNPEGVALVDPFYWIDFRDSMKEKGYSKRQIEIAEARHKEQLRGVASKRGVEMIVAQLMKSRGIDKESATKMLVDKAYDDTIQNMIGLHGNDIKVSRINNEVRKLNEELKSLDTNTEEGKARALEIEEKRVTLVAEMRQLSSEKNWFYDPITGEKNTNPEDLQFMKDMAKKYEGQYKEIVEREGDNAAELLQKRLVQLYVELEFRNNNKFKPKDTEGDLTRRKIDEISEGRERLTAHDEWKKQKWDIHSELKTVSQMLHALKSPENVKRDFLYHFNSFAGEIHRGITGRTMYATSGEMTGRDFLDNVNKITSELGIDLSPSQEKAIERTLGDYLTEGGGALIPMVFQFAVVNKVAGAAGLSGFVQSMLQSGETSRLLIGGASYIALEGAKMRVVMGEGGFAHGVGFGAANLLLPNLFKITALSPKTHVALNGAYKASIGMTFGGEAGTLVEAAVNHLTTEDTWNEIIKEHYGDDSDYGKRILSGIILNSFFGLNIKRPIASSSDIRALMLEAKRKGVLSKDAERLLNGELNRIESQGIKDKPPVIVGMTLIAKKPSVAENRKILGEEIQKRIKAKKTEAELVKLKQDISSKTEADYLEDVSSKVTEPFRVFGEKGSTKTLTEGGKKMKEVLNNYPESTRNQIENVIKEGVAKNQKVKQIIEKVNETLRKDQTHQALDPNIRQIRETDMGKTIKEVWKDNFGSTYSPKSSAEMLQQWERKAVDLPEIKRATKDSETTIERVTKLREKFKSTQEDRTKTPLEQRTLITEGVAQIENLLKTYKNKGLISEKDYNTTVSKIKELSTRRAGETIGKEKGAGEVVNEALDIIENAAVSSYATRLEKGIVALTDPKTKVERGKLKNKRDISEHDIKKVVAELEMLERQKDKTAFEKRFEEIVLNENSSGLEKVAVEYYSLKKQAEALVNQIRGEAPLSEKKTALLDLNRMFRDFKAMDADFIAKRAETLDAQRDLRKETVAAANIGGSRITSESIILGDATRMPNAVEFGTALVDNMMNINSKKARQIGEFVRKELRRNPEISTKEMSEKVSQEFKIEFPKTTPGAQGNAPEVTGGGHHPFVRVDNMAGLLDATFGWNKKAHNTIVANIYDPLVKALRQEEYYYSRAYSSIERGTNILKEYKITDPDILKERFKFDKASRVVGMEHHFSIPYKSLGTKFNMVMQDGTPTSNTSKMSHSNLTALYIQLQNPKYMNHLLRNYQSSSVEALIDHVNKMAIKHPVIKRYAEYMQNDLFKEGYEIANPVYRRLYMTDMGFENNYLPIEVLRTLSESLATPEMGKSALSGTRFLTFGNTHERLGRHGNVELIQDARKVGRQYMDDMIRWASHAEAKRELTLFLRNPEVRKSIESHTSGKKIYKALQLFNDNLPMELNHSSDWWGTAIRNVMLAPLQFNAFMIPKQALSGTNTIVDYIATNKIQRLPVINEAKYMKDFFFGGMRKEFAEDLAAFKKRRAFQGFDLDIHKMDTEGILGAILQAGSPGSATTSAGKNAFGWFNHYIRSGAVRFGDILAFESGRPVYIQAYDNAIKGGMDVPLARKYAMELTVKQLELVQQSNRTIHKSVWQLSGNSQWTPYFTTPLQYQQRILQHARNIARGDGTYQDIKGITWYGFGAPYLYTKVGGMLISAMMSDKRKKELEEMERKYKQSRYKPTNAELAVGGALKGLGGLLIGTPFVGSTLTYSGDLLLGNTPFRLQHNPAMQEAFDLLSETPGVMIKFAENGYKFKGLKKRDLKAMKKIFFTASKMATKVDPRQGERIIEAFKAIREDIDQLIDELD